MRRFFTALCLCMLAASLAACGGKAPNTDMPSVALAMEGPPLAVVGEYKGKALAGEMDRTVMAGVGELFLEEQGAKERWFCQGALDAQPTEKGRVRGMLTCSGGEHIFFSLRNLGPDQGVGVGKTANEPDRLTLFYHSSKDEAERRFPGIKSDMDAAGKAHR